VASGPCPHCGEARGAVVGPSAALLLLGLSLGAFQCDTKVVPTYGTAITDTGGDETGDTGDTGATTPE
jgi:hypothetical protein